MDAILRECWSFMEDRRLPAYIFPLLIFRFLPFASPWVYLILHSMYSNSFPLISHDSVYACTLVESTRVSRC